MFHLVAAVPPTLPRVLQCPLLAIMEAPSIRKPAIPVGPNAPTGAAAEQDVHLKAQEEVVRKFAAALGKPKEKCLAKEIIASLLAKSLTDQDVVLKVPSFDVQFSEENSGTNPLPGVGETSKSSSV